MLAVRSRGPQGAANLAGRTEPVLAAVGDYFGRTVRVIMADRFADALLATVDDEALCGLPLIGGVDQHSDSTDVLQDPAVYRRTSALQLEPRTSPA